MNTPWIPTATSRTVPILPIAATREDDVGKRVRSKAPVTAIAAHEAADTIATLPALLSPRDPHRCCASRRYTAHKSVRVTVVLSATPATPSGPRSTTSSVAFSAQLAMPTFIGKMVSLRTTKRVAVATMRTCGRREKRRIPNTSAVCATADGVYA
jgi:hypothetical protein